MNNNTSGCESIYISIPLQIYVCIYQGGLVNSFKLIIIYIMYIIDQTLN